MFFCVGLGNPGPKYLLTRHNIGFMAVDYLAGQGRSSFNSKWKSEFLKTQIASEDIFLQKPLNYMNLSGGPVQQMLQFYKGKPSDLIVIHDDISMPFGALKLQKNRSAGGHNGLKDINQKLGTQDYNRLKVGVGMPSSQSVESYVLSNFSKEEQKKLPDLLVDIECALRDFIQDGLDKAANKHNRKQMP